MDAVVKEDGDIDNDGDEDESDEYLASKRAAISKAIDGMGEKELDEIAPAVAAIARVAGPALARGAASGAGMAAGEKMMGDQDEDPGDEESDDVKGEGTKDKVMQALIDKGVEKASDAVEKAIADKMAKKQEEGSISLKSLLEKDKEDPFVPTYGKGDVVHDCPKHVKEMKTGKEGKVVSHSLNEAGEVNYVDVDFGTGKIYENIPTKFLKVLKESHHKHEVKAEPTSEAAPKMRKNKEAEQIQKLYVAASGLKKGGGSGRYGKEFDTAKKKMLKAFNDMLTYSKIGG